MVVVAAGGEEGRTGAEALRQLEAEHVAIESEGAREVGDFEVHVADAGAWIDGSWRRLAHRSSLSWRGVAVAVPRISAGRRARPSFGLGAGCSWRLASR